VTFALILQLLGSKPTIVQPGNYSFRHKWTEGVPGKTKRKSWQCQLQIVSVKMY